MSGAINGKGVDDPAAGLPVIGVGDYNPDSAGAYDTFDRWNWTHPDLANGNTIGNAFYLQYRIKLPASRFAAGQPDGKLIYVDYRNGGNQELIIQALQSARFDMYQNYGRVPLAQMEEPQGWGGLGVPRENCHPGNEYGATGPDYNDYWTYPPDEWVTFLLRFIPGEGNTTTEGWGTSGPSTAQMVAAQNDPDFAKTQITVWAAASTLPNGSNAYTKIWDKRDYIFSYDPVAGTSYNIIKFSAYSNGVASSQDTYHRLAEIIFSKEFIPCPQV